MPPENVMRGAFGGGRRRFGGKRGKGKGKGGKQGKASTG